MPTVIQEWLLERKAKWSKSHYSAENIDSQENKNIGNNAVDNFINFAFSDDLCFLDEDATPSKPRQGLTISDLLKEALIEQHKHSTKKTGRYD